MEVQRATASDFQSIRLSPWERQAPCSPDGGPVSPWCSLEKISWQSLTSHIAPEVGGGGLIKKMRRKLLLLLVLREPQKSASAASRRCPRKGDPSGRIRACHLASTLEIPRFSKWDDVLRLFSVSEVTWHVEVHPPRWSKGLGDSVVRSSIARCLREVPCRFVDAFVPWLCFWAAPAASAVAGDALSPATRRVSVYSEKTEMSWSTGLCSPCLEERRRGRSLVTVMSIADCSFTADLCRASGSLPLLWLLGHSIFF